jgi:hypothetical protein
MNTRLLHKSNELRDSARRLLAEADGLVAKSKTATDLIEHNQLLKLATVKQKEAFAFMFESHIFIMEYCKLQRIEIAQQKRKYLTKETK